MNKYDPGGNETKNIIFDALLLDIRSNFSHPLTIMLDSIRTWAIPSPLILTTAV